jgi:hypothetical protein
MLGTIQNLGVLGALGSTMLSLGCCAGLLGPLATVLLTGGAVYPSRGGSPSSTGP